MHKNGLVVSLQVNGEFCKEIQNEVYLPFNSTYEIYLKNKTDKYVCADVFADDKIVIGDLLLNPYESISLKRFFEGDNSEGHSLKFIKMTEQIRQHRGTKSSDGTVKVNWKFGRKEEKKEEIHHHHYHTFPVAPYPWWEREHPTWPKPRPSNPWNSPEIWCSSNSNSASNIRFSTRCCVTGQEGTSSNDPKNMSAADIDSILRSMHSLDGPELCSMDCSNQEDAGLTTHGAPVSQGFTQVNEKFIWEYPRNEIILKLWGAERALTKKIECEMCGTIVNVKQGPYCPKCGTYLL